MADLIGCACRFDAETANGADPLEWCPFHERAIKHAAGVAGRRLTMLIAQVEHVIKAWDEGDCASEIGELRRTLRDWEIEEESRCD